jgi:hypothetical protein
MANSNIIQQNAVSEATIKAALDAYIKSQAPELRWLDFFESGPGTIIEELMAGLGAFKSFQELATRVESTLDYARLLSSVYELAFNRGFLVPPCQAAQVTLFLVPNVTITVAQGDLVGTMGNYNLYSFESKTMPVGSPISLQVVVGYVDAPEDWIVNVSSSQPFSTIVVYLNNKNVARQLELLTNGTDVITLVDDIISPGSNQRSIPLDTVYGLPDDQILNIIHTLEASTSSNPDVYVLRRVLPNQVRIYLGNGTLGFYDPTGTQLTYRRLTYNDDVNNILTYVPIMSINANLASFTVDNNAELLPNTETVRGIARYYPIDGRVVQDNDYSRVIMKYYAAFLYDAYAFYFEWPIDLPDQEALPAAVDTVSNTIAITSNPLITGLPVRYQATANPIGGLTNDTIYYVVNSNFSTFQLSATLGGSAIALTSQGTGTHIFANPETEVIHLLANSFFTPGILSNIEVLIASRMAQGIRVMYKQIPSSSGKTFYCIFSTVPGQLTNALSNQALNYLKSLRLKFYTEITILTTNDLCIQLSSQIGIPVYPGYNSIQHFSNYGGTIPGTVLITSVNHGLPLGMSTTIIISGTINYNGTFSAIPIDANTFYITAAWVADDGTGTFTGENSLTLNPGDFLSAIVSPTWNTQS